MTQTVYILAGGNDRKSEDYGRRLSTEVAKYIANPKIFSCFFSSPKEVWAEKAQDWQGWFAKYFAQPFTYDYAKLETILDQMDAADVIYFHGGDTRLLFDTLPNSLVLKKHFKGKIIIGSSAGANMLSKHYWSSSRGVYDEGRNILDVNVMAHYGAPAVNGRKRTIADWAQEETEFKKRIQGQPIIHLPEGNFATVVN